MTTIEIDIDTYNNMLSQIKSREQENIDLAKENRKLSQIIEGKNENLEIFRNANWYDRVFGWKQILKLTKDEEKQ